MNRRKAIKNLALASGGLITLPQWMVSCGISDTTIHQTSFSHTEKATLAVIADTIIPASEKNPIGALTMGVDAFLIKLLDDCYERNIQDNVKAQIKKLDESAKVTHNKIFASCTQVQKEELLSRFSTSAKKEEKDFFDLVKSETIRGFNTSQKVMQEYLGYKVAPGYYYGCVDVNTKDHA